MKESDFIHESYIKAQALSVSLSCSGCLLHHAGISDPMMLKGLMFWFNCDQAWNIKV